MITDFTDVYYVDSDNGNNGNAGTSMSAAWADITYAITNMAQGSIVFVRRGSKQILSANVTLTGQDHLSSQPGFVAAWPRAAVTGVRGDFVNGSLAVSGVIGVSLSSLGHGCRMIIGPDGEDYMIVECPSSGVMHITPPYKGADVAEGGFSIAEDPLYDYAQGLGAGDGVDTDWDSDAPPVPEVQTDGSYVLYFNQVKHLQIHNINFEQISGAGDYLIRTSYPQVAVFEGCFFKLLSTDDVVGIYAQYGQHIFRRCVFDGMTSYDSSSYMLYIFGNPLCIFSWCAFKNTGYIHIYKLASGSPKDSESCIIDHCHFGYNGAFYRCGVWDFYSNATTTYRNCIWERGDASYAYTTFAYWDGYSWHQQEFINCEVHPDLYQPVVLGNDFSNVRYIPYGNRVTLFYPASGADDTGTTVTPRTGGSDILLEIDGGSTANEGARSWDGLTSDTTSWPILTHWFFLPSGTHTIKYYMQNSHASTLASDNIWIELETSEGSVWGASKIVITKSSDTVAQRSSGSDWSKYVSATADLTASGQVRCRLYYAFGEGSSSDVLLDPQPEITTS